MLLSRSRQSVLFSVGWCAVTVLLSWIIMLLPFTPWTSQILPLFPFLVIAAWSARLGHTTLFGLAWFMGCVMDMTQLTVLGEQALAMSLVLFILFHLKRTAFFHSLFAQMFVMMGLVWIYQCVVFLCQAMVHQVPTSLWFWFPCVTSAMIWPIVRLIVGDVET